MSEKLPQQLDSETLFRYQVVSTVLSKELLGWSRARSVHFCRDIPHHHVKAGMRHISERSIYRWLSAYENEGLAGLCRSERSVSGTSLAPDFLSFLIAEKEADARTSIPELIKRAKEKGILAGQATPDRVTVWRALRRHGVATQRRRHPKHGDCRRFVYPHRMDMVLCDGKHFRAGQGRHKRVALFFIDDASRYVLNVIVGTSENTRLFLQGLYQCISCHGLMRCLFLDNGPGFRSDATREVVAQLGIPLVLGTAGYPEGHGKVERFNQTVKEGLLRLLDKNVAVDPHCRALELRLTHYLDNDYNRAPHEGLNGLTPLACFQSDSRPLDYPDNWDALRDEFALWIPRTVSNDHVISFDGTDYEVPRGYRCQSIHVRHHLLDDTLGMIHNNQLIELQPVDLIANAHRPPKSGTPSSPETTTPLPPGSAELAFRRDLSPLVDDEGNFFKE